MNFSIISHLGMQQTARISANGYCLLQRRALVQGFLNAQNCNTRPINAIRMGMLRNSYRDVNSSKTQIAQNLRNYTLSYAHYARLCGLHRVQLSTKSGTHCTNKTDNKSSPSATTDLFAETANLSLFAKFKIMYKKYWYVLIPVHLVTSIGWFGCFYYMSKSGVDVPSLLEYVQVKDTIIEKVRNSNMGHFAIAYLCYKIATPLRYAVTLGGTTISIKRLVQAGLIKPMPTKQQLIRMYEDKKAERTGKN